MTNKDALYWCEQFEENVLLADPSQEKMFLALQAMKQCKQALEKQIPKKLNYSKEEKRNEYMYSRKEVYRCPCCNVTLYVQHHKEKKDELVRFPQGSRDKHCYACGQALQWGE